MRRRRARVTRNRSHRRNEGTCQQVFDDRHTTTMSDVDWCNEKGGDVKGSGLGDVRGALGRRGLEVSWVISERKAGMKE